MQIVLDNLPYLLRGALVTVALALASIVIGSLLGIAAGLAALLAPRWVRSLVRSWTFCTRGVPVLVVMFCVYFALPSFGIDVSGPVAVGASLSFYVAAFYAEILRGAVESLPRSQREAGLAIGLTKFGVVREVLLPQALPFMAAPWLTISIVAVKSTAYASIVGVWELTFASREVVERTLAPFPIFFGAMLIYFAICFPLAHFSRRLLERPAAALP